MSTNIFDYALSEKNNNLTSPHCQRRRPRMPPPQMEQSPPPPASSRCATVPDKMSNILLESKKLCFTRCLTAVGLSIFTQYILLGIFLLCINFHVLHLLNWLIETFHLMISPFTWLSTIPLLGAILIYGILLAQSHLAVKHYYPSRFKWLMGTVVRKFVFLDIHIAVGFLTTWLYAQYLHIDYRSLLYKCYDTQCINSYYLFLVGAGISASCYHFFKEHLKHDPEVEFPMVQEKRYVKLRSLLYSTLYNSLVKSFVPTLLYALVFWLLGDMLNRRLALFFDVEADTRVSSIFSVATNVRLLFYSWILSSQILSNMHLMQKFFSILLAEEVFFPIESPIIVGTEQKPITLVQALNMSQVPVIQNLAAYQLYRMGNSGSEEMRRDVFALSIPGGHPYNWNQLSSQCITLINAFVDELSSSMRNISIVKTAPLNRETTKLTATEAAERILLRQYNETYGIRRMNMVESPVTNIESPSVSSWMAENAKQPLNDYFVQLSKQLEKSLHSLYLATPGLYYMFSEPEGAKTAYLLSNTQMLIWLVQGLAGICAVSLTEDRFGVVQVALPQIIRALLRLKGELDKLNNVNLNGKKLDDNLIALKSAIKRSLYRIISVFGDYLRDLFEDPLEVRSLQCYLAFQDA